MPPLTKHAIVTSFLKIAERKSFDKITVRDVVDDCGVNRNTFYYHFQDIFSVVEELCENELVIPPEEENKERPAPISVFLCMMTFTKGHIRAIQNIYASIGHDLFEKYLTPALDAAVMLFLNEKYGQNFEALHRDFYPILVRSCRHAVFDLFADWLRDNCREDPELLAKQLTSLFIGETQPHESCP